MIRKLQIKFIAIIMSAIIVISVGIYGITIIENYRIIDKQTDTILTLIADNNGKIPDYIAKNNNYYNFITEETQFATRFFTVEIDNNGQIVNTDLKNIAAVEHEEVENMLKNVKGKEGYFENYKYKVVDKKEGKMIIFLDCTLLLRSLEYTAHRSMTVILIILGIIFIILILLSKKLLKPITKNIEKQKQFITNASHELKTPLAVINADIDVLEISIDEENEWLQSIKKQVKKLNILVRSLLKLANVEDGKSRLNLSEISINEVINEEVTDIKPLVENKNIIVDSQKDIIVTADKDLIKQVIVILLDNAIKYTQDDGTIKINLDKKGKNAIIEVCNTCDNIQDINTKRLFDRFYRNDSSRNSKKEGYGIGLSIAKSIVDVHKGKLSVYVNKENMICFRIIITGRNGH